MLTYKEENWEGCSPALKDAIYLIDLLLKANNIKAECKSIYLQYKKYDGFALYIDGEHLNDAMLENIHLQFQDDYEDFYEGNNIQYNRNGSFTTEIYVKENPRFYVTNGESYEEYAKDMPLPERSKEEISALFDKIFELPDDNFSIDDF